MATFEVNDEQLATLQDAIDRVLWTYQSWLNPASPRRKNKQFCAIVEADITSLKSVQLVIGKPK